jgi:ABC-type Fe3+ transport system permease subunit
MLCSPWKVKRSFGRTCLLHLQGRRISQARHQYKRGWQARNTHKLLLVIVIIIIIIVVVVVVVVVSFFLSSQLPDSLGPDTSLLSDWYSGSFPGRQSGRE